MPEKHNPRPGEKGFEYPAEKARQGEIVLRRRWQRLVFIAGLAGMAVLALAVALFAAAGR